MTDWKCIRQLSLFHQTGSNLPNVILKISRLYHLYISCMYDYLICILPFIKNDLQFTY